MFRCAPSFLFKFKFQNFYLSSYITKTDPKDVARVESKTFISTKERYSTVPHTVEGVKCILGQWLDPQELNKELSDRFPGTNFD